MSQILTQTITDYLVKTIPNFTEQSIKIDTQDQETLVTLNYMQVNFKFGLDIIKPELDPDLSIILTNYSNEILETHPNH